MLADQAHEQGVAVGVEWPWSSKIRSRGFDLSATQAPKAATRASRLMKPFWRPGGRTAGCGRCHETVRERGHDSSGTPSATWE